MDVQRKPKLMLSMVVGLIAGLMLVTLGCTSLSIGLNVAEVGPLKRESVAIERGEAERVNATVRMAAGALKVKGGADALLDADFTYNVTDWEPEVTYQVDDSVGRLDIRHTDSDTIPLMDDTRNEWDLRLNDTIPIDLRIEMGAGDHDIDLEGLALTELDVKLGAGDLELTLGDNPDLTRIELDIGAGDVAIDFNEGWEQDTDVSIQGGVGKTTLILPQDTGVRITATQGIGDIDTAGLVREGGAWINDAYGSQGPTMEIDIQTGIGEINIVGD